MAEPVKGSASAGRARWIIVLALAGLGLYLYMRYRKQQSAAAAPASAAAQGDTNTSPTAVPTVPVYNLSGSYDGPYTPYNVINNGVTQPSGVMPGQNLTQAITDAAQNGVPVNVTTNTNQAA